MKSTEGNVFGEFTEQRILANKSFVSKMFCFDPNFKQDKRDPNAFKFNFNYKDNKKLVVKSRDKNKRFTTGSTDEFPVFFQPTEIEIYTKQ